MRVDRMALNILSRKGLRNFLWCFKVRRLVKWRMLLKDVFIDTIKRNYDWS